MTHVPERVLVVGAGISGLAAATALERHGVATIVVDKGRAPGGRMASKTIAPARFDQGAQHLIAESETFRAQVDDWCARGVARPWGGEPEAPRFVGVGGMRTIPEDLADGLDVHTGATVTAVSAGRGRVTATLADGTVVEGVAGILTPPLPQLLALVAEGGLALPQPIRAAVESVTYDPCLAVMARLDRPSGLDGGHLAPADGAIAWMADNQDKGVSTVPSLTIHSTAPFATAHLEDDPSSWLDGLVAEARPHLSADVIAATGRRWRYSQPRRGLGVGAMEVDGEPLVLAGDAFTQAGVEGAFLSGLAAAELVLERP